MSKRKERLGIIFLLYRHYVMHQPVETTSQEAFDLSQSVTEQEQVHEILEILKNINLIESIISNNLASKWEFKRLSNFHKAILICCTYEILWKNIPRAVIVNEALEIAKLYGENTDVSYLNSVLDKVNK